MSHQSMWGERHTESKGRRKERERDCDNTFPHTGLSWISLPALGLERAEALCGSVLRVNNAAGAIPVLHLERL